MDIITAFKLFSALVFSAYVSVILIYSRERRFLNSLTDVNGIFVDAEVETIREERDPGGAVYI